MKTHVSDLRAEQARAQRALLREQTADTRTPTPHAHLNRGFYEMEWQGFRLVVHVNRSLKGEVFFTPPSGYDRPVSTVPDARFYRLPEALQ